MTDIGQFIRYHLLAPLQQYPTIIQHTIIEILVQKLKTLYEYAVKFPEIITPGKSRMDILQAIADQFLFTVREDGDIQEQIDILDNILYVYRKRGSVDSIENMWKYYGGELPKDVKVVIPSYNLFRYSMSKLSGKHVFQDNTVNRTGTYEVRLINNNYPIPDLREFLLKELVAAGNYIYFTNTLHMDVSNFDEETNPYNYTVYEDNLINIQMDVLKVNQGLTWSGYNTLSPSAKTRDESLWSGKGAIFLELIHMIESPIAVIDSPHPYLGLGFLLDTIRDIGDVEQSIVDGFDESGNPIRTISTITNARHKNWDIREYNELNLLLYCTSQVSPRSIENNLYNANTGELLHPKYPGCFILGETLLGKEIV